MKNLKKLLALVLETLHGDRLLLGRLLGFLLSCRLFLGLLRFLGSNSLLGSGCLLPCSRGLPLLGRDSHHQTQAEQENVQSSHR